MWWKFKKKKRLDPLVVYKCRPDDRTVEKKKKKKHLADFITRYETYIHYNNAGTGGVGVYFVGKH